MHYIYKIKSPSGKIYIGQTKRPSQRKSAYKYLRCVKQKMIYNSLLKYGWINHSFEIICTATSIDATNELEEFYIKKYKDLGISLNISNGGDNHDHKIDNYGKEVVQLDVNGSIICTWRSCATAGRALELDGNTIAQTCRTNQYYYKGFLWIYKTDLDKGITPYKKNNKIKILVFDKNKILINKFDSISAAARYFSIDTRDISSSIKNNVWYKSMYFIPQKNFKGVDSIRKYRWS